MYPTDKALRWDAYRNILPNATVAAIDRHGMCYIYDGPVYFNRVSGCWQAKNNAVTTKTPLGLMTLQDSFKAETSYEFSPVMTEDDIAAYKKVMGVVLNAGVAVEAAKTMAIPGMVEPPKTVGFSEAAFEEKPQELKVTPFTTVTSPRVIQDPTVVHTEVALFQVLENQSQPDTKREMVVTAQELRRQATSLQAQITRILTLADELDRSSR